MSEEKKRDVNVDESIPALRRQVSVTDIYEISLGWFAGKPLNGSSLTRALREDIFGHQFMSKRDPHKTVNVNGLTGRWKCRGCSKDFPLTATITDIAACTNCGWKTGVPSKVLKNGRAMLAQMVDNAELEVKVLTRSWNSGPYAADHSTYVVWPIVHILPSHPSS